MELLTVEGGHVETLAAGELADVVAIGPSGTVAAGLLGDSQGVYTWVYPFGEPDHQWSDLEPRSIAFHPHTRSRLTRGLTAAECLEYLHSNECPED